MLKRIKALLGLVAARSETSDALGIKWIQSMHKLEVRNGDLIVVRHPAHLGIETCLNLRTAIREIFMKNGFDIKVVMFDEGMDIGILRREASEDGH